MKKRIFSFLLAFVMLVGMLPVQIFATERVGIYVSAGAYDADSNSSTLSQTAVTPPITVTVGGENVEVTSLGEREYLSSSWKDPYTKPIYTVRVQEGADFVINQTGAGDGASGNSRAFAMADGQSVDGNYPYTMTASYLNQYYLLSAEEFVERVGNDTGLDITQKLAFIEVQDSFYERIYVLLVELIPTEPEPVKYQVNLTEGAGFTLRAAAGSASPVEPGSSFSFTISINESFEKTTDFAVKANGVKLEEVDGKYTISNIQDDQTVTVEGVVGKATTDTLTVTANGESCNVVNTGLTSYKQSIYGTITDVPVYKTSVPADTDFIVNWRLDKDGDDYSSTYRYAFSIDAGGDQGAKYYPFTMRTSVFGDYMLSAAQVKEFFGLDISSANALFMEVYGGEHSEGDFNPLYGLLVELVVPKTTYTVNFALLGDHKHADGEAEVHTLIDNNLEVWVAAKDYEVVPGATILDLLSMVAEENNLIVGNPNGDYVKYITKDGVRLSEFTNGARSGWMYTINGNHSGLGVAEQKLADGDVIIFHYTDDYTREKSSPADLEAAAAVVAKINAIGTVSLESKAKIEEARAAYDALSDEQRDLIGADVLKKLTDAEAIYTGLEKDAADEAAAKVVADKIDAIGTVTLDSEKKIVEARESYDALTDVQKALVANREKLFAAEDKLVELKDQAAADAVEKKIADIGTVTLDSEAKIKAARDAYNALTDNQKKLVENYKTLTDAESKFAQLNSSVFVTFTLLGCSKHGADQVHTLADGNLSPWITTKTYEVSSGATVLDLLNMVASENNLTVGNPNGDYVKYITKDGVRLSEFTNGSRSGWMYTLNGNHSGLGVAEQKLADGDVIVFHYTDDYTKERNSPADQTEVDAVAEMINAIGTVTMDSKEKIEAARAAYDALSDAQQALIGADVLKKLTDAETTYAGIEKDAADQAAAKAVEDKISAIGTVTMDSKAAIDEARAAYEELSDTQKNLVSNYQLLGQAETAYAELVKTAADEAAAKVVADKIDAIGTVTLDSEKKIVEARESYDALTDVQKALVANREKLFAAEDKLVELKDQAAADAVEKKIADIGTVTLDSEAKIKAARDAYNALTDTRKALVENLNVLEAAEEALELLKLAGTDIANIYQTTGDYLTGLAAPTVGSTNGEWRVIGLTRAGITVADSYYDAVAEHVKNNIDANSRLDEFKSTENSRVILALTAIGKDVTDVGGHNLLMGLNDMTYISKQGINGLMWALIAFDAHNYEIPTGDVTREKLVKAIVDAQTAGGGWTLNGNVGDPDMTGMALQALAPYYGSHTGATAAVNKALTWLSGIQNQNGNFSGSEGTASESLAQVITGLTALGINPETDSRFVKNGVSAVDALSQFYVEGGGFKHVLDGEQNMMATEQAYYALVSYYRLLQEKTSLFDMSDVIIQTAAVDQEAADAVEVLINAIGTVTEDSGDKINAARNAYDALTDAQKQLVENYKTLTDAEAAYAELVKTAADEAAAKAVEDKIAAIGKVTLKREKKIVAARTAYDKLTAVQKALVGNYDKLTAAEQKLIALKDEAAANEVEKLIKAIGTVTKNSGDKIKAARDAYDKLTDAQKKLVENYKTLTSAESKFEKLTASVSVTFTLLGCSKHGADQVHTLIDGNLSTWIEKKTYKVAPGATVKDVLEKALADAGITYKNPTGNYVESINGIGEFTNGSNSGWMYTLNGVHPSLGVAEQTVKEGDKIVVHYTDDYTKERSDQDADDQDTDDQDETAAAAVEKLIDAIGTVTLNSKSKIDEARKAYDALTNTQKQKVGNYKKLTDAEAKYAELKKADDEKKADAVEALIDKIDNEITLESEAEILAARKAYDALSADQKKLVENYKVLTDAEYDLALLKADEKDKEAAGAVEKLISAIGTVTLDSEEKIKAARDAYDKLTDTQKMLVRNYAELQQAEEKMAELKALAELEKVYKTTGEYLKQLGTPVPGSVGGEWMVIGLIRSGNKIQDPDAYYEAVVKFVRENIDEDGRLHKAKSTENSRIILALTALGKDVTNVGGHNLLAGLGNMEYVRKQGINGPIWALMALDSGNYPVPEGDVTREALIQVILDAQLADGGWALTGTVSDADITGMALQALARYCKTNAEVKSAVDAAVAALSEMQAADGSFGSVDGSSSESVAQVIAALSALGIDADADSRFMKNGVSAVDALCAFYVEGGGFKHIMGGKLDGMATEQGYYALAAYFRMRDGKTALFDMTDVVDMGGDLEEDIPAETMPTPTEPEQMPEEEGRSFPWWLVIVIVVLSGAIVVLVIISKSKKHKFVR